MLKDKSEVRLMNGLKLLETATAAKEQEGFLLHEGSLPS